MNTDTNKRTNCPECGGEIGWYTVGAPGIGGGWYCLDWGCGWDEAVHPTRILTPEETI